MVCRLLKKLPHFIRPGRRIYISTNERTPGFFAPLRRKYRVHMLRQYKHLWSNRSHWYKWSRTILKESHGFDVRMQVLAQTLGSHTVVCKPSTAFLQIDQMCVQILLFLCRV